MKILLVEDEVKLSEALVYMLKKSNYIVDAVFDGLTGLEYGETELYDLIILDRMLPKMEGIEVLKNLRKAGVTTPVLFLTAKDAIKDRIEGLDSGADDYMVKPFSKEELLARVRALGRRASETIVNEEIQLGDIRFNPLKREILYAKGVLRLSSREAQILETLMKNKDMVITKELLIDRIWGFQADIEANNVEVYMSYLRKKLSQTTDKVVIETIRGCGYCLKEVR